MLCSVGDNCVTVTGTRPGTALTIAPSLGDTPDFTGVPNVTKYVIEQRMTLTRTDRAYSEIIRRLYEDGSIIKGDANALTLQTVDGFDDWATLGSLLPEETALRRVEDFKKSVNWMNKHCE
jgi:hypothetical protein